MGLVKGCMGWWKGFKDGTGWLVKGCMWQSKGCMGGGVGEASHQNRSSREYGRENELGMGGGVEGVQLWWGSGCWEKVALLRAMSSMGDQG